MNSEFRLIIETEANNDNVRVIEQNLNLFNKQFSASDGYEPLNIFIRNEQNHNIGGLLGETYWSWLHIRILWIDDKYRKRGFGKQLVMEAEKEAQRRGCKNVHLDTHDFQAEEFYKKLGYIVFGVLDDLPLGHKRIYMRKVL